MHLTLSQCNPKTDDFLLQEAGATSCFCLSLPLQREPFGDNNPVRDAESMSPGEKICLRLQKAYLQQAVLVTFIKIEHWAFFLPCFLCFWQEVVIVKHWIYCTQQCGESLAVHSHVDCKTGEMACWKDSQRLSFIRALVCFYRLWRSVCRRRGETCNVTKFSQPLILSCTPSRSIMGSEVSGGHVCHNLLGFTHSMYWRSGQEINRLDWAARPRGRSPYPSMCGSNSALLCQAFIFVLLFGPSTWIPSKGLDKKGEICSIWPLYSTDSPFALQANMQSLIVNVQEGLLFAFDFIKSKHHLIYHPSKLYTSEKDTLSCLLVIIKHSRGSFLQIIRNILWNMFNPKDEMRQKHWSDRSFEPAHPCLLVSTLSRGSTEEHREESRSMTPWQPLQPGSVIISLPAHINSYCCVFFLSILTTELLFLWVINFNTTVT